MDVKASEGSAAMVATKEDIARAYELVLGRVPDEKGLAYFVSLAASQRLASHDVAKLLINSEEFRAKNGGLHDPVEVTLNGYSLFVRASDRDIGNAIAKGGAYEPHVTALVCRELSMGDTFLDVGANMGYFSMLAAHLVGPKGKVIAVEPMDKNLQLIYLGIEKNGWENIEVFPFGASDHAAMVAIITDPNTSNALVQSAPSTRRPSLYASVRTLDWMCADIQNLSFIKMDIEGHEVFAWRGAKDLLARFKPKIATEFHPYAMRENSGIDCQEYVELMFDYADVVNVIVSPENMVACLNYEQVMEQWQKSDQRHGGSGTSHLDLYLAPRN